MSTQAKYGWAIGLIVAGIVGALPFRHSNPATVDRDTVVQNESSEQVGDGAKQKDVEDSSETAAETGTNSATQLANSPLLPDRARFLPQFDQGDFNPQSGFQTGDQRNSAQDSTGLPSSGQVVEQVPNRLNRNQLPDSINQNQLESNALTRDSLDQAETARPRGAKLGPVELAKPEVRREMPRDVGPYRMRRVPSSKFSSSNFSPASQSGSKVQVRPASRTRKVVHYKLRDGDSLRSIAQRYLGDADRFEEILADNQHILTNGESFLPVGQYITIVIQ